jgi:hypothetical protein
MYAFSLVLGVYIYSMGGGKDSAEEVYTAAATPIVPMLSSRVTAVAIRWSDRVLTLRRDGERWAVDEPADAAVTSDLVSALLDTLTTIAPIELIAEGEGDAEEYGLKTPVARLRITGDLDKPVEIAIGGHNPTRTAVYAGRVDEDRIYLIGLAARYYVQLLFEELAGQAQVSPAPSAAPL